MIHVAGEPFIGHQLRLISRSGISEVVLLCGFLGEQIQQYVQDGSAFGCHVRYSFDGSALLGTGGALRKALPMLGERFMVMYGDSYCPSSFLKIYDAFVASDKRALMTIVRNNGLWDKSNVEYRDGKIIRYDKIYQTSSMEYIDYGINMLSADAFSGTPKVFDLTLLQTELLSRDQLVGYVMPDRFYEIGSLEGLAETDAYLRRSVGAEARQLFGERP
jgi:NDP-sugar pyrophosphorylase family protein